MEWKQNGCSIMSDGWTDKKERSLVNFLMNSLKRTMFMKSIDASSMVKAGEKLFKLLDNWVEEVGEDNVVQVITNNASNYMTVDKDGQKKPKKSNRSKNQTKIEPKNRLTELSDSILVFVLHKSRFRFSKYKNHGLG